MGMLLYLTDLFSIRIEGLMSKNMYNFNSADVVAEVRKLAQERPDFVYTDQTTIESSCSYVYDSIGSGTGEGCIVGQALNRLGVDKTTLIQFDEAEDGSGWPAGYVLEQLIPNKTTEGDVKILNRIQMKQDFGSTWKESVN